ncbi:GNAT superfamily N-acetyltransferase [Spinactinospora alkalitolerans]|uniref:GNAT superfamily N-acetyltransferase n=1 Tax=Spinactinospora alkalitolerans TaxID=687207 RepID=A0A852TSB9_9ACTN|nr:GNAT family N-acetyltransferase [Spinactinospora alkalitolerans]NYE46435.1 GNAT superfamily N-acetyltransferase [Spinactinospora alkalitolerans]
MNDWAGRVAADWPALHVEQRGGWRLGYSEGVTKRANSAFALEPGARAEVPEEFYPARGLAPCVQVWRGGEALDAELAGRGYRVVDPSLVMERELGERPPAGEDVAVAAGRGRAWREVRAEPDASGRAAEVTGRIMDRAAMGYAVHGSGLARGCAALNGEWVGVYAMFTRPEARGTGLGAAVLDALLRWGHDKGARRGYLLVTEDNAAARALYRRAGFGAVSGYHYRVLDSPGPRSGG